MNHVVKQASMSFGWSLTDGAVFSKALSAHPSKNWRGPMLAKRFVEWRGPVITQPKIDGIRLMVSSSGAVTRSGLQAAGADYLMDPLSKLLDAGIELDGEWNIPGLSPSHIEAIGFGGGLEARPFFDVFDYVSDEPFSTRSENLKSMLASISSPYVRLVETVECGSSGVSDEFYSKWISQGYEGQMVRNPSMPYVRGRSNALLKRKPVYDAADAAMGDCWSSIFQRSPT